MNILGPSAILLTSVTFQVEYQPASQNEVILISGNSPQLGQWEVSKAVELSLCKTQPNAWSVTVSLPSEILIEYKYMLKVNNKIKKWEGFSGTRKLKPTGLAVLVDDGQFGTDATPELSSVLSASSSSLLSSMNSPIVGSTSSPAAGDEESSEIWEKGPDGQARLVNRRRTRRVLVDFGWLVNEVQLRVYLHKRTSFTLPESFSTENSPEVNNSDSNTTKGTLHTTVSIENLSSSLTMSGPDSDCTYNEDNIFSANPSEFSYACIELFPHMMNSHPKLLSGDYRVVLTPIHPMALLHDESTVMDECFVINAPDSSKLCFQIDLISKNGNPFQNNQMMTNRDDNHVADDSHQQSLLSSSQSFEPELLGRVSIHSHELSDKRGYLKRTIINKQLEAIGVLSFQYMIITPFVHPYNSLAASLWHRNWGKELLYIGHRGSGATDNANEVQNVPTENTLLSFLAAARLGADYIEFDVQLTKDNVPIIAHDEEIVVVTTSRDGEEISLKVPVNKLSLAKLRRLKPVMDKPSPFIGKPSNDDIISDITHHDPPHQNPTASTSSVDVNTTPIINEPAPLSSLPFHRIVRSKSEELINSKFMKVSLNFNNGQPFTTGGEETIANNNHYQRHRSTSLLRKMVTDADSFWNSLDTYPTLEQAFRHLPPSVGFNVELKYPDAESQATYLSILERNQYVDHILQVLFDCAQAQARSQPHAPPRHVLLSSFDPEICQLCAAKQPGYPVFFLTTGGTDGPVVPSLPGGFIDPRRFSLAAALAFARQARLAGLVSHADAVLQAKPSARAFVSRVHRLGLLLFTYGRTNGELHAVQAQQEAGVDAVICDRVFRVKRASRDGAAPKSNNRNPYIGNFWVHPPATSPSPTQ